MFLENAVLHDHAVVGLEASGLSIELVDDPLAIVVQQLLEARVAGDRRTVPAVDDCRGAGGGPGSRRPAGPTTPISSHPSSPGPAASPRWTSPRRRTRHR